MRNYLLLLAFLLVTGLSGQDVYLITDYGARDDSTSLSTAAIQTALDAAHQAGGGTVIIPRGNYLSGSLRMYSHTTLHLRAGARLLASRDSLDYVTDEPIYKAYTEALPGKGTPVLLYAKGATDVSITGQGTIDGRARRTYLSLKETDGFIQEETDNARRSGVEMMMYYKVAPYVCLVFLEECTDIMVSGVSLIESTDWTLHFKWCARVRVSDLYIRSSFTQGVNADGIDIDGSRDVVVTNCIIHTGDDAIVLKSTRTGDRYEDCVGITVSNCSLISTSTALKIGTETWGDFRHITFSNCSIRNTNRGMGIIVRDGGTVSDVLFTDITVACNRKHFNWWGNGDPFWLVVRKRNPSSRGRPHRAHRLSQHPGPGDRVRAASKASRVRTKHP